MREDACVRTCQPDGILGEAEGFQYLHQQKSQPAKNSGILFTAPQPCIALSQKVQVHQPRRTPSLNSTR
ncbi:hypothetical protein TNCV_510071 [Trichonephila clavipes]|nr:hypothetical protein TNCV_510071 [Trichonephila clavipes]